MNSIGVAAGVHWINQMTIEFFAALGVLIGTILGHLIALRIAKKKGWIYTAEALKYVLPEPNA